MPPTSATAARRRWPRPKRAENSGTPARLNDDAPADIDKRAWRQQARRDLQSSKEPLMKLIASGLLVLGLMAAQVSEASAAACAAGRYHAGCVGPRGAVVTTHRPAYGRPVYGAHCYW